VEYAHVVDGRSRHARFWRLVFPTLWLVYWVIPIVVELQSNDRLSAKAGTLLAAALFIALYIVSFHMLLHPERARVRLAILGGLCAIAIGLSLYGFELWGGAWIYCAVVAVWVFPVRRAWVVVAAMTAASLVIALTHSGSPASWAWQVVAVLLAGLTNIGVRRMAEVNRELATAREEIARLAVAEERLRFARDLHDLLGHSLSVIVLKSELAGRLMSPAPERASREIEDVERVAREALREVRETVAGYRQPGLAQELDSARSTLTAAGMHVNHVVTAGALPAPLEGTLAWAVREGVTNVIRHSRAETVTIRLFRESDAVHLEMDDDGDGASDGANPGGSGLRGLRERVEARDGTLQAGPRPEGGFRLAVTLPLKQAPQEAAAAVS
jgi:two-component system sensor histidine kinase DesK